MTEKGLNQLGGKSALLWAGIPLLLLVIPASAMALSAEVVWDAFDFAVAALLLSGAGAGLYAIRTLITHKRAQIALAALFLLGVTVVWVQGAVGLI